MTEPVHTPPVIDSRSGYRSAVAAIRDGDGPVAIDTERASGYKYSQRAYLIQVFRRGAGTFLFDPPAVGRFDELAEEIINDEWVLHAASQDLDALREVGLDPVHLFDTELAGRLLGLPRVALGTVVEELLGIHLKKEHSAADWSIRPLPEPWLVYAALDVELLVDLRDVMEDMLADAGKMVIAAQEFEAVLQAPAKPALAEPWRRLSGVSSLRDATQMAVARELWLSRDALARNLDIAPGRLVPDASLMAAVRAQPQSRQALAAMKDFRGRASRTELARWWHAIESGRASSELPDLRAERTELPSARNWPDRNPEAHQRLKTVRALLAERADELQMPVENLLKPSIVRDLAWEPPADPTAEHIAVALEQHGARPWQIVETAQLIAAGFVEALQVEPSPDESAS